MIGTVLKAVAYSKAPRTTFTVMHPAKAVLFRKFQWDMRHAAAPRVSALGAMALAIPLGMWLGRRRAVKRFDARLQDMAPRSAHGPEAATDGLSGPRGEGLHDVDQATPFV